MADNVTSPLANGTSFASDDIGGVHHPYTKIEWGADGTASPVSETNPLPTNPSYLTAGTNRSGSIAAGNTAQTLAPANITRRGLVGQNISSSDLWINEVGGNAAIGAAGSYKVAAGEAFSINTNRTISILGATTGQSFTAVEF